MDSKALKDWRKSQRERLVAERAALSPGTVRAWRERMDGYLARSFPGLSQLRVAMCWPIKNEYDPRYLAKALREQGAVTALPVVVAPRTPLVFREWHPGVKLATGPLDIPYPVDSADVVPQAVLLPMNGWDMKGYRLGYGAGFFDRTLASMATKPTVIGVSYEQGKLETIHPQAWDIPVDYLVTERGVYRRDAEGLVFLGAPQAADDPSALSSPVCYAGEVRRD